MALRAAAVFSQRRFQTDRTGGAPMTLICVGILVALHAGLAAWGATQYIAHRYAYHENLGPPLFGGWSRWAAYALSAMLAAGAVYLLARPGLRTRAPLCLAGAAAAWTLSLGPVYNPWRVFTWTRAYRGLEGFADVLSAAQIAGGSTLVLSAAVSLTLLSGVNRRQASNAHGTARWGTGDEFLPDRHNAGAVAATVRAQGRTADRPRCRTRGVLIGRHPRTRKLMWYRGESHILTLAPTRSGKGTGAVIPNLLYYSGSVVCTDIKGENFQVCGQRRFLMGQQVYALDPFGVTVHPSVLPRYQRGFDPRHFLAAFNPMALIDVSGPRRDFDIDDAQLLASMLVNDEGGPEGRHWVEEAKALIAGLLIHIAVESVKQGETDPEQEHLVRANDLLELRRLLTLPGDAFSELFELMSYSPHEMARRTANRLLQKDERERSGVISSAQSSTQFLDSRAMRVVLSERSALPQIPLERIKTEEMSIFLVLPPKYLKSHAAWLRLMIVCANQAITASQDPPQERVLFMLDEFANLGHMEPVLTGISLVGGYGTTFWLLVQDLSQLKRVYKEGFGTLFGNCDVKQMFGTNDQETAELLSKMTGDATVFSVGGSQTRGRSYGKGSGRNLNVADNVSEKGRKLLLPDEVLRMKKHEQLLFVKNSDPMIAAKIQYWDRANDPEFAGLWLPNPMHG